MKVSFQLISGLSPWQHISPDIKWYYPVSPDKCNNINFRGCANEINSKDLQLLVNSVGVWP